MTPARVMPARRQAKRGGPASPAERDSSVDRVRGFAIACMIVDHVALVFGLPPILRHTIGRLAMPLFFVTAGRCSTRLTDRHFYVGLLGVALPLAVPWIDHPNVLVWWALGCVVLAGFRWAGWSPTVLVLIALGLGTNGWLTAGDSYPALGLWGLMGFGAMLPWTWWRWGSRLPAGRLLEVAGRHPIALYVGHLLLLEALRVLLR